MTDFSVLIYLIRIENEEDNGKRRKGDREFIKERERRTVRENEREEGKEDREKKSKQKRKSIALRRQKQPPSSGNSGERSDQANLYLVI